MSPELFLLALAVGLGTWAMRYLPLRARPGEGAPHGLVARFLRAIGPSAIAAMVTTLMLPYLGAPLGALPPAVAGIAGVLAVFFWRRDVTLATMVGALCYGLAFAFWG